MQRTIRFVRQCEVIFHWKYWPTLLFYIPVITYVAIIGSLRMKRFFYFAAANPNVPMGGFSGDSKFNILSHVPAENLPRSVFIKRGTNSFEQVMEQVKKTGIEFPLIAKPDLGERGFLVKKLKDFAGLEDYHGSHDMDYLIQDYIAAPIELSILLHNAHGAFTVSSFIEKQYMLLKGDGHSTISELLQQKKSGRFKKDVNESLQGEMDRVLGEGEEYVPLNIGNWSYGTRFINRAEYIDCELEAAMTAVNEKIGLFNYARYDIKCDSIESLKQNKFFIIEINGVKGEPLHIYTDKVGLWSAYADVFRHWEYILKISKRNISAGAKCPGLITGVRSIFSHVKAKKQALKAIR